MTQTENDETKTSPVDGAEKPKKKKAPKAPVTEEKIEELDQEVPVKAKKKRAPKIDSLDQESNSIEEPIKKKKKPKAPPAPAEVEEDSPIVEPPASPVKKKSKKSKKIAAESFDDLDFVNPDAAHPRESEISLDPAILATIHPSEAEISEYQQTILDAFANLASKVNFAEFLGEDQWTTVHPPKTARTEQKSRLRKMLPGGNKDPKTNLKPPVPKESLMKRIRSGVSTLVTDPSNMIFGVPPTHDLAEHDDDPDGVDTDDLHRYAQKLRELEDQDREVNPEYLVLRDGKTIYGVHEADQDGKTKLATRKPIFDRYADQKPDEQVEKKKLLARLKIPFARSKEKSSKSANATPDPDRKALNDIPLEL